MNRFSLRYIYRKLKMKWYRFKFNLKHVHETFFMAGFSFVSKDLIAAEYVFLGKGCLIPPNVTIGRYTMFAPKVSILGGDHNFNDPSTPIIFSGRPIMPKTQIGEDVWVGSNVLIMAGITIGNGAIVAAGSVVTRDIPPYSIYGGNVAKLIKMRFSEEQILEHQKMLKKTEITISYTNTKSKFQ